MLRPAVARVAQRFGTLVRVVYALPIVVSFLRFPTEWNHDRVTIQPARGGGL